MEISTQVFNVDVEFSTWKFQRKFSMWKFQCGRGIFNMEISMQVFNVEISTWNWNFWIFQIGTFHVAMMLTVPHLHLSISKIQHWNMVNNNQETCNHMGNY
jgi:hypothetical protein